MTDSEKWIVVSQLHVRQQIGKFRSVIDHSRFYAHTIYYDLTPIAWQTYYGNCRHMGNLVIGADCTDAIVNELAELLGIG